uniref:Uncharacterized protein n=1 Tax=Rhizophora mucronata TaxID=61149 RepID=A0A2P2PNK1_RHIMU
MYLNSKQLMSNLLHMLRQISLIFILRLRTHMCTILTDKQVSCDCNWPTIYKNRKGAYTKGHSHMQGSHTIGLRKSRIYAALPLFLQRDYFCDLNL